MVFSKYELSQTGVIWILLQLSVPALERMHCSEISLMPLFKAHTHTLRNSHLKHWNVRGAFGKPFYYTYII